MSVAPKPRAKQPTNGKAKPAKPAGCQYRTCPEVERAGDVSQLLSEVLARLDALSDLPEQVAALDAHVGALMDTVENVKSGLNELTGCNARLCERVDKALTGGIAHA